MIDDRLDGTGVTPLPDIRRPAEQGTAYTRPPAEVAARATAPYVPRGARAELRVRRGPNAGARYPLPTTAATRLGRHPECAIVLGDVTVSRHHAEIHHEQGRFVLMDRGSRNGTYLNRAPAIAAVLADGDEIAIGVYRLTVHIPAGG